MFVNQADNMFGGLFRYFIRYQPTKVDIEIFSQLGKAPENSFAHALRWYNHIKSFSEAEKKSFADGVCPMKTATPTCHAAKSAAPACPVAKPTAPACPTAKPAVPACPAAKPADDDDDVDLFGSDDEEDVDAAKIREERLQAYAQKKLNKPVIIAKSSVVLDVKPWDDKTDMKAMEKQVRTIEMEGLVWGASKLVPVGYGINKLQIMCIVEDEKVSIDLLSEKIEEFQDFVQSVDTAAFNKI